MRRLPYLFLALLLVLAARTASAADYVVAVSEATLAEPGWAEVADALIAKHGGPSAAERVTWKERPSETLARLQELSPRYVAVVARYPEVTREFTAAWWELTRQLDEDPYGDAVWGVVTGLEAADALRIARCAEPLAIRYGLAASGGDWLAYMAAGEGYSEGEQGRHWTKTPESAELASLTDGPPDTTRAFVDALNSGRVDMMWTSGHASEHDWQIGYSYPNGMFVSQAGVLAGVTHDRSGVFRIESPNPKVYYAPGNCLIGHIDGADCMALAWQRSGGAMQMCGYTVETWYGFMGWGVAENFVRRPGQYTFAQAVHLANQQLVYGLVEDGAIASEHDKLGHAWDKDAVVLYGDPAWEARIAPAEHARGPAYRTTFLANYGAAAGRARTPLLTWRITALEDWTSDPKRPVADLLPSLLLPGRLPAGCATRTEFPGLRARVCDDLILVSLPEGLKAGQTAEVEIWPPVVHTARSGKARPSTSRSGAARPDAARPGATRPAADADAALSAILGSPAWERECCQVPGHNRDAVLNALLSMTAEEKELAAVLLARLPYACSEEYAADAGSGMPAIHRHFDHLHMDADTLLAHVRLSLAARKEFPWCAALTEQDFRDYVLAHRGTVEALDNWRLALRQEPELHRRMAEYAGSYKAAPNAQARSMVFLGMVRWLNAEYLTSRATYAPRGLPDLTPAQLFANKTGRCTDLTNGLVALCRTYGIAATGVRTIWWPKGDSNHYWASILDPSSSQWHDVDSGATAPLSDEYLSVGRRGHEVHAKVYRVEPGLVDGDIRRLLAGREQPWPVEHYLVSLPLVDVTEQYAPVGVVERETGLAPGTVVYLSVWNNDTWNEAAVTAVGADGIARFERAGCRGGVLYLVTRRDEQGRQAPVGRPGVLTATEWGFTWRDL